MNINAITTTQEAQKGFYPTPPELADKLLAGLALCGNGAGTFRGEGRLGKSCRAKGP